ncbi:phosphonate metabolism transcriptional regulator PhnF [Microbacterium sp.]|uniref:phosphonate metabolism transcriptional regulator PhnF n=1 Tax=Microbacterium sp. TaxID=51671 RepID=UPI003C711989
MTSPSRTPNGYSAWRLIAEELRAEIAGGQLRTGDRLPTEKSLAERFSVNRHTARQALAALAADGLVESRRGSGTFVIGETVHVHRIGMRTRLTTSIGDRHSSDGRVVESAVEPAPPEIARALRMAAGADAIRVESLRKVDGQPLGLATRWFDAARLPDIAAALRRTASVTAALRACGVEDYVRVSTAVAARHATVAEGSLLQLEPGAIVLVTEAVDALLDGTPLQHGTTRFAAGRVRLDIEHAAVPQAGEHGSEA